MQLSIDERKKRAIAYFTEGYNCAQSVFLAYSDLFGVDEALAKKISVPFGGGMGKMGEVCGAFSASFMLVGLQYGTIDPKDADKKTKMYASVQQIGDQFKALYGTLACAQLVEKNTYPEDVSLSEASLLSYADRPCIRFVERAAEIIGQQLVSE